MLHMPFVLLSVHAGSLCFGVGKKVGEREVEGRATERETTLCNTHVLFLGLPFTLLMLKIQKKMARNEMREKHTKKEEPKNLQAISAKDGNDGKER